jgi:hypothetical protein
MQCLRAIATTASESTDDPARPELPFALASTVAGH